MVTLIIEDEADTVDWGTFRLVKTALVATISVLLVDDALFGLFYNSDGSDACVGGMTGEFGVGLLHSAFM